MWLAVQCRVVHIAGSRSKATQTNACLVAGRAARNAFLRTGVERDACAAEYAPDGALAALQTAVCTSPPAHYTRGGTRPLLYATVLAITLQYRKVLEFLHTDKSAASLRDAAAVLAAALFAVGFLTIAQQESSRDATPMAEDGGECAAAAQVCTEAQCAREQVLCCAVLSCSAVAS